MSVLSDIEIFVYSQVSTPSLHFAECYPGGPPEDDGTLEGGGVGGVVAKAGVPIRVRGGASSVWFVVLCVFWFSGYGLPVQLPFLQ